MPYVRYSTTIAAHHGFRVIARIHNTQAAADADTTANTTAYTGLVGDINTDVGHWVKVAAAPSVTNDPALGTVRTIPPDATTLETKHLALHVLGRQLEEIAADVAPGFSDQARQKFHDLLFRVRQFHYLLATSTAHTDAQRTAWETALRTGAKDLQVSDHDNDLRKTVREFYRRAEMAGEDTDGGFMVPAFPTSWVDPSDGSTIDLRDMDESARNIFSSRTIPTWVDLATGNWIAAMARGEDVTS